MRLVRFFAVDDEEDSLTLLREILETAGAQVTTVASSQEALDAVETGDCDLLLQRSVGALKEGMQPHGFNLGMNLGQVAGAGIPGHVHWHVVLDDWEPWRDGPAIAADAIAGARAHGDGAVILLHAWPGGTGEAVPVILEGLRDAGASFVGIDELEAVP